MFGSMLFLHRLIKKGRIRCGFVSGMFKTQNMFSLDAARLAFSFVVGLANTFKIMHIVLPNEIVLFFLLSCNK